jgi:hypothetical protein
MRFELACIGFFPVFLLIAPTKEPSRGNMPCSLNEERTRKELIDPQLEKAG